jgi:hypothetical protein
MQTVSYGVSERVDMRDASAAGESPAPTTVTLNAATRSLAQRTPERRRRRGVVLGLALTATALTAFFMPGQEQLTARGAMNSGHESLACNGCHRPAPGTLRQQLQAGVRFALGLRSTPADFGNKDVTNDDCLSCHERPFDRHSTFRFDEPRFAAARQAVSPQRCESCHREHSGVRVSVEADYCRHCHSGLELKQDPLDVPHAALVRDKRWETCLGCHDFHGNHLMTPATSLAKASPPAVVARYFAGGPSPYPSTLRQTAKQTRSDRDSQ